MGLPYFDVDKYKDEWMSPSGIDVATPTNWGIQPYTTGGVLRAEYERLREEALRYHKAMMMKRYMLGSGMDQFDGMFNPLTGEFGDMPVAPIPDEEVKQYIHTLNEALNEEL